MLLGSDMFDGLDLKLSISDLESALPDSYKVYKNYVPLYSEYKDSYLEKIAELSESLIKDFYDYLYSEIVILANEPEKYLSDDTSLTMALKNRVENILTSDLFLELNNHNIQLEEAFEDSSKEFNSIRDAYLNLNNVGYEHTLPKAEMVSLYGVSKVTVDSLFDALANAERTLKNKIVDRSSDSLYSIFWEGR